MFPLFSRFEGYYSKYPPKLIEGIAGKVCKAQLEVFYPYQDAYGLAALALRPEILT